MSKATISELQAVKMLDKLLNRKVFNPVNFGNLFKLYSETFGWFDKDGNAATPFSKAMCEEGAKLRAAQ